MAATTGFALPSMIAPAGRFGTSSGFGVLPKSRMSAPAMNARPAPVMTTASTPSSARAVSRCCDR